MSVTQTVYHAGIPVDLAAPSRQQIGTSQFFYGDNRSHVFTALVGDTDHPETGLRSGAVTGAVLRHDGVTVVLAGEKGAATVPTVYPNGKAANATACSVTLPQECFAVPGPILITIKLVDGETVTSVLNIGGTVIRVETDSAVDPGEIIPDVSTLAASARAALAAAEEANTAAAGAETAAQAASSAATDAGSAAESAYAAVDDATAAANAAYDAASAAGTAASAAGTAASAAGTAATAADTAATAADTAATAADTAATAATTAAANAESKGDYALVRANAAIEATNQAVAAALEANTAATAAGTAATAADTAASGADTAAQAANAAAAAASAAMAGAVRFDAAQTLTEAQAAQARGNIGAASAGDIPTGAVRYDEAQTLAYLELRQARQNIAAVPTVAMRSQYVAEGKFSELAQEPYSGTPRNVNTYATGELVTLNGTSSSGFMLTLLGSRVIVGYQTTPTEDQLAEGPFNVVQGHTYRLRVRKISGTQTGGNIPYVEVFDTEGHAFSGAKCNYTDGEAYFTLNASQIGQIGLFVYRNATYSNVVLSIEVQDMTEIGMGIEIPVSGTTPSITAIPGAAYNCTATYVETLSFTPSATGVCSVRFVSGTTPTVLTLPNTVKMPDWWSGVEANRTYEISIADGVYGAVTSWA